METDVWAYPDGSEMVKFIRFCRDPDYRLSLAHDDIKRYMKFTRMACLQVKQETGQKEREESRKMTDKKTPQDKDPRIEPVKLDPPAPPVEESKPTIEGKAQALEQAMRHLNRAFTHMTAATLAVHQTKDYYKLNQLCKISGDIATLLHVVQADIQRMSDTMEF